jgi:hypothetical protein
MAKGNINVSVENIFSDKKILIFLWSMKSFAWIQFLTEHESTKLKHLIANMKPNSTSDAKIEISIDMKLKP